MRFRFDTLGLGVGSGSVRDCLKVSSPRPKEWLHYALAGAGLLSSLVGGIASGNAAKKAQKRQRAQEAKENAWYNRRYNEDYLDTAAGQNLVRRAKEYAKENWKKAAGAQAVAGGTNAATQMAKDAGNRMVGDTMANIAAQDTARKAQVDNMHRQAEAQYAQMDMQRENLRAQSIANAAQGASNAMMSAAAYLDGTPNLKGGSNKSTDVAPTGNETGVDYSAIRANNPYYSNMSNTAIDEHFSKQDDLLRGY